MGGERGLGNIIWGGGGGGGYLCLREGELSLV